jgi:hypothetical protein
MLLEGRVGIHRKSGATAGLYALTERAACSSLHCGLLHAAHHSGFGLSIEIARTKSIPDHTLETKISRIYPALQLLLEMGRSNTGRH